MWPTIFEIDWPFHLQIRSYGLMLMIGFLGGTWWATRRAVRTKANPELIVNLGFVALVTSIVGARLFYVIHYWDEHFAGRGLMTVVNITQGGLEFYGGFLGAFLGVMIYLWRAGVSLRLYLDIIAPSLAFGLAVTRIGCFLNGCCWGGPCASEIPWSVRFPYESSAFQRQWSTRLVGLPAELIYVSGNGLRVYPINPAAANEKSDRDHYRIQAQRFGLDVDQLARMPAEHQHRGLSLHPAQLYASIGAGLLAFLLSTLFYRRKRHGILVVVFLTLYPLMRIAEETIRMDNPYDTAGLTVSQFVSLLLLAGGVGYYVFLRRLPLRSPKAVPWVSPWLEADAKARPERAGKPQKHSRR